MKQPRPRPIEIALLLAIVLLALGLRLYRLDAQSLWNDEGTSVALAQRDLATITRNAAADIHPPLYYYLLHAWVGLFGTSEFAVRALSALAGAALVVVTYTLARPLLGAAPALLGAFLASLSPFQVYYSQETRMYILATLLGAISTWLYLRLLSRWREGGRRVWPLALAYLVTSVAAVYSHYFAFAVILAQNVGLVLWLILHARAHGAWRREDWGTVGRWAALQLTLVAAYVPWLILSWRSLTAWPAVSEAFAPLGLAARVAHTLAWGVTVTRTRQTALGGLGLLLVALAGLWRRPPEPPHTERRWGRWALGLWLAVPVLVIYGASLSRPIYKPKFLLLLTPAYYLLIAQGIMVLAGWGRRLLRSTFVQPAMAVGLSLAVCGVLGLGLYRLYTDASTFRDDYRGIAAYIEATAGPDDAVLINAPAQIETVDYYYDGPLPEYPLPRQRPIDIAATEEALGRIVARHERIYAILWATDESDPEGFIEGWLDRHCYKAMDSWFGNVRLAVYAVPEAPADTVQRPLDLYFGTSDGDRIRLQGYTLLTPQPRSGEIVQLSLFWEALAPVARRYKVFTHLVDAEGHIVGQRDSEPGGGGRLTTTWAPGERVVDHYGLQVRVGTPPGPCTVRVGLYALEDGQRLPVSRDGEPLGDAVDLAEIDVLPAIAPPPLAALDMRSRDDAAWGDLELVGHNLYRLGFAHQPQAPLRPGDVADLTLFWRHDVEASGVTPGEEWMVALADRAGQRVWEQPATIAGGRFPIEAWRPGEVVRDVHHLHLPAVAPGRYELLVWPATQGPEVAYRLARLELRAE